MWILLLIIAAGGPQCGTSTSETIEFETEAVCLDARREILRDIRAPFLYVKCLPLLESGFDPR
jgi:hypothetical protein